MLYCLCTIPVAADIGIIGGADGPTAVFVTGVSVMGCIGWGAAIAVSIVAAAILWRRKRKK